MRRQILGLLVVLALSLVGVRRSAGDDANAQPTGPSRWPMYATASDGSQVTIFQPQLEDFQGNLITAHAAVAVMPSGAQQAIFGAIWLQTRVAIDRVNRTVQVLDVNVTKVLFPSNTPVAEQPLDAAVKQAIMAQSITLSLDHLLASVEALQKQQSAEATLQITPPAIIYRDHPSVKVQYDGSPVMGKVSDSGILRAMNTPFFVAQDPATGTYDLKGAGHWFTATDPTGPFKFTTQISPAIMTLATQSGYTDPQTTISDEAAAAVEIVVATQPTELIWTNGQPQMGSIPGTNLLYWSNTESDVFVKIDTQQMYVLLSGRWFTGKDINGPWTFVPPDQLPPDFAHIPEGSPKANVLASVPRTQQAQDALADTMIPQTAAVDTTNFDQPSIDFDGDPQFEPIPGTDLTYCVNTDGSIVDLGNTYYCCYDGVWYMSGSARGPWGLCRRVPKDIYTIPPACPLYPITFCYVYGYTDQEIYCGYTPGYVGCYGFDGVVVFGTGYYYHPWHRGRFFPHPYTYGFAATYHPYSGQWGFNFGVALGGGGHWVGTNAGHERGGRWFGYGGYRPALARPNNNIDVAVAAHLDLYGRDVYDQRHDVHPDVRGVPARPVEAQPVIRNDDLRQNNVYTNRDGDVYRRTDAGGWEKREGDQWKPQEPAPQRVQEQPQQQHVVENPPHNENPPREQHVQSDVQRDYQARQQGENRSQQASPPPQESHSSGGESGGGGGGGGGGDRGGGGGGGGGKK